MLYRVKTKKEFIKMGYEVNSEGVSKVTEGKFVPDKLFGKVFTKVNRAYSSKPFPIRLDITKIFNNNDFYDFAEEQVEVLNTKLATLLYKGN